MYFESKGGEVDLAKVCYWFEQAAEQSHKNAQYNVAVIYFEGLGGEVDLAKARYWFERVVRARP